MEKNGNQDVAGKYVLFTSLLKDRKKLFISPINVDQEANHSKWLEGDAEVRHAKTNDELSLLIQVRKSDYKRFKFKLRCETLCAPPFFRYDSDGSCHRNKDDEIPLAEQIVPTPHFNTYNEKGVPFAYQTDILKDDKERKALEDVNLCVKYFCIEANIRLNADDYPDVMILPNTLGLTQIQDDPTANVKFL